MMMPVYPGAVYGLTQTQRLLGCGGSKNVMHGETNNRFPLTGRAEGACL